MLAAVFEYSIQRTRVGIGKQPRGLCKNTRARWRWQAGGSEVVTSDQTADVFTGKADTIVRWKESEV